MFLKSKLHFVVSGMNVTQLEMLLGCHFGNAVVVCTFHICVVFEPPMPSTNNRHLAERSTEVFSCVGFSQVCVEEGHFPSRDSRRAP